MHIIEGRAQVADAVDRARAAGDSGRAEQLEYLLARWDALLGLLFQNTTRH